MLCKLFLGFGGGGGGGVSVISVNAWQGLKSWYTITMAFGLASQAQAKKRNQNLTEIENRHILFLCDGFRKIDLGIDLIAKAFRGSIQNTRLFSTFYSFIFCSIIYLFGKLTGEGVLAYPQMIV